MDTLSYKEDHISQVPALQMLVNLGYTYLSTAEADRQRGGKTGVLFFRHPQPTHNQLYRNSENPYRQRFANGIEPKASL